MSSHPGNVSVLRTEKETIIQVDGKFSFGLHRQFRDAYRRDLSERKKQTRYIVDLSKTEFIDSSALGMLIILREEAGSREQQIELAHAHPEIRKVLEEASFQRLFQIT
ncbi:STAS domain-containing protein [Candidatus Magnetaquicoccus inordinatus]|uniref:STAS domain-containing protein n=1 Tax=Candidatus Magnetaquicoccus inordinatus TaxID=2496818 RepID=UPI00102B03EC|nr:STAS domain-containing protein [Candidatus Magnetaquicoccus inordinatus]